MRPGTAGETEDGVPWRLVVSEYVYVSQSANMQSGQADLWLTRLGARAISRCYGSDLSISESIFPSGSERGVSTWSVLCAGELS